MEMRRHAATTPTGEKLILGLYWALSGYGLRAGRALTALARQDLVLRLTGVALRDVRAPRRRRASEVARKRRSTARRAAVPALRRDRPIYRTPAAAGQVSIHGL